MRLEAVDIFMFILASAVPVMIVAVGLNSYVSTVHNSACTEAHYKQIKLEACGDKE